MGKPGNLRKLLESENYPYIDYLGEFDSYKYYRSSAYIENVSRAGRDFSRPVLFKCKRGKIQVIQDGFEYFDRIRLKYVERIWKQRKAN